MLSLFNAVAWAPIVLFAHLSLQIGCADWIEVKVLGERILRIQKKPFLNRLPACPRTGEGDGHRQDNNV
jgi:hypothetical protein